MALKQTKNRNGSVKSVPALRRCGLPLLMSVLLAAICLAAVRPAPPAFAQTEATGAQGRGSRPAGVTPKRPRGKAQPDSSSQKGDASSKGAARPAAAKTSRPTANAGLDALSPLLAAADFDLIGLAVTANPPSQTVPKNTPTSVLVSVKVPEGTDPAPIIAGLNPNYRVRGELTGPSLSGPRTIEAPVGQPLPIPPLAQAGEHLLQNLRVVDISQPDEAVVAPVTPDACGITVIERILVSEVHVNELTYDQIVQAGINISDDSYKAFNFTIGLGTTSNAQTINIPVAFPTVGVNAPLPVIGTPTVSAPGIDVPTVVPVLLTPSVDVGGEGGPAPEVPMVGDEPVRIPGVVVFPGRVGFLHQFFEAIVIVSNGAPGGAPLVLRNLHAKAKLPDAGTPGDESDDPLRIAETQTGGRVSELDLHGLGPDQKYGTADDTTSFGPGEAGQATFLLEGLKEGLHTVNFDLDATLEGLPSGPVKVTGTVPGAVLVRDASFAVTFTHPAVVRAGQEYDLAMTLLNTGGRDIQGAFARLAPGSISGAELVGQDTGERQFPTTIVRKDSATIKWRLRASTTGEVTASYVKVGDDVSAGLALVTGVGDRNVPLSPESLILPDPVRHLPPDFVEAARAVLGQAWGVANAPAGSLPAGVQPITKQSVIDRAVELGLAGMRVDFGETTGVSIETLMRDWLGELKDDPGFADALRETPAGNAYYDAIGTEIYKRLTASGPITAADYQRELADTESSRSPFISALLTHADGQPLAGVRLVNASNQRVGFGASPDEREVDLANGAALFVGKTDAVTHAQTTLGQMALASNVAAENWTLELTGWRDGAADLSLLYPATGRTYRHVVWGGVPLTAGGKYRVAFRASSSSTATPVLEIFDGSNYVPSNIEGVMVSLDQPAPRLVGAIQVTPDVVAGGDKYGRLVGLLFSKPMLRDQAETLSKYAIGGGQLKNTEQLVVGPVKVRGAHLDYGDRFVFLSLDSPTGPYIRRDITVSNLSDARRMALAPSPVTMNIDPRVSPEGRPPGAYLTGRVLNADGTPVAGANVIYWVQECPDASQAVLPPPPTPIAVRTTDTQGRYQIDYVRDGDCGPLSVTVTNPVTHSEKRLTSPVAYDGQHMVFDMVFLARGSVQGTVTSGGQPAAKAFVNIVPALDAVGAQVVQTDDAGRYTASGVPVGNVSVFAVGTGNLSNSSGFAAGNIDGPNQTATINVSMQNTAGRVSGRVVRSDGGPAVGALVVAYAVIPGLPSARFDHATAVGYAYADRDGQFTISKIPVGDVTLEVTDYVNGMQVSQHVTLTNDAPVATGLLLTLPGLGSVSGHVLDETGAPVPGAFVSAAGRSVQADAGGAYTLTDLPAGTHRVSAFVQDSGQGGSATAVVRAGQTTEGVNVVILRPATVEGQVLMVAEGETTPQPVAGAYVSSDGYDLVQTDAQGNYRLTNVAPNTQLTLRFFETKKMLGVNMPVILSPGETLSRNVTFRPGTIRGRVTQPDGVTGAVADLQIFTPRPSVDAGPGLGLLDTSNASVTRSGADGSYSVSANNPGAFRVSASSAFFPTPVSAGGSLAPSGVAECNLSLVSTLAGKIQGRVFRPDGTTPAGAGVRVSLGGGALADATVRTDESGHYEFGEVFSAGGYALTATDPVTGNTNRIYVSVEKNKDAVFDLRLLGTGSLRVKVVDGGGQPVTSGSVTLDGSAYPNAHRYADLTADGGGVIVFDNLSEGPYAVAAADRGLGGRAAVNVPAGSTVETTVRLQASGTVQGRVLMPGGASAVGLADVQLTAGGRSIGFAVTSDDDAERGSYKFLNVPAGDFTVDVFDNRTGRVGRSGGRIDSQGQTVTVDVELVPVGAVAGRVTSNGQPVDHALVQIYADGSGVRSAQLKATTDADGRYRFTGIPVGRFRVDVSDGPGGQGGSATGAVMGTVEPLPDTVVDIALEPSQTVAGTVYRAGGTEPVPGAQVTVTAGGRAFRAAANDAGVYRLGFVPLGQVSVRAEAPTGYDRGESATVNGSTPGATLNVNVTLAGVGSVSGIASDSNGAALAVGTVTYTNDAWYPPVVVNAPVSSSGRYEIADVPAGPFGLSLAVPNRVATATASGTISAGQSLDLPLRLEDAGGVRGSLKSVDGASAVAGADVALTLSRPNLSANFYTHTDSRGAWSFDNVPLGTVSVRATDPATGASAHVLNQQLTANGQTLDLGELRLHAGAYGMVRGHATNAAGQAMAGVQVTLAAANGTFQATTAADGGYSFEPVDVGNFTVEAVDASSGFRTRGAGSIASDEQVATVDLRLVATGTVAGTVFRHDGTTPIAGALVQVFIVGNSPPVGAATTDAQGHYSIDTVPVGNIYVEATDAAAGDRGVASGQLTFNGQTLALDVAALGFGQVVVTVRDAAGDAVAGAQVTLTTTSHFSTTATLNTQADGTATFAGVLAGSFDVSATDPRTGLRAEGQGSVEAGGAASVALQLQPVGSITGRVLAPDGATPVAGISVRFGRFGGRSTTSGQDGVYRFDGVPINATYTLYAFDDANRVRGGVAGLTLSTNGQVLTQDIVLVGRGMVTGKVFNPDGTVAQNVAVNINAAGAGLDTGTSQGATTDYTGAFTFNDIPVGHFTLVASDEGRGLQGDATGELTRDGETASVNVQLVSNAINLPTVLYDANNFPHGVTNGGANSDGYNYVFHNGGAFNLDVVAGGTATRFTGSSVGSVEDGGREIAIRQSNVAGLNVTRKVYVPRDGYFARYLEVVTNPTQSPVSVSVRVQSTLSGCYYYNGCSGQRVIRTSSGDDALDTSDASNPDRWVVIDDATDADPFESGDSPATAFVFDGAGAARRAGFAGFNAQPGLPGQLQYEWDDLTLQPGETVAYIHFGVQQTSRAAARASAERLTQLPPEALAGLSATERGEIRNFAVPADGSSTLTALPATAGSVAGHVLAGDNATGVGGAQVNLKSSSQFFGRTYHVYADSSGAFGFASAFNDAGTSVAIPVDSFTLTAHHPLTGVDSPVVPGGFAPGQTSATRDIVFADTGNLRGVVRRQDGTAVTSGYVNINSDAANVHTTAFLSGTGGAFALNGIPAGAYNLAAFVPHPQGVPLQGTATANVSAGQTTVGDVTIQPTGAITGTVRNAAGTPSANTSVRISDGLYYSYRSTVTDASGTYTLTDVPAGAWSVIAVEPNTGVESVAKVTLAQGQTLTQDFALNGLGQVQVQVNYASGTPAPGSRVDIKKSSSTFFGFAGNADSSGRLTIPNVPTGPFTVRAYTPSNTSLTADVSGNLATNGAVVPVTVGLPPTGSVRGHVTLADGTPAASATIRLSWPSSYLRGSFSMSATTNASGDYSFANVEVGRAFTLLATNPTNSSIVRQLPGNILTGDGQTLTLDVSFQATANVRVTVLKADGSPQPGYSLSVKDASTGTSTRSAGPTGSDGVAVVTGVPVGPFIVSAYVPYPTNAYGGSVAGTVTQADQGQTINVTIAGVANVNVEGTVYAGGQPRPSVFVTLVDTGGGSSGASATTDAQGKFRFTNAVVSAQGYSVLAHAPWDFNTTASAPGRFGAPGETVVVDVTLPGGLVRGKLFYADGVTPVVGSQLWLTQTGPDGTQTTYFKSGGPDGNFTFEGVRPGDFSILAQSTGSMLTGTATGTLPDVSTPVELNVTLPPAGKVRGVVRASNGAAVAGVQVTLSSPSSGAETYAYTDSQGVYQFPTVGLGQFFVQAKHPTAKTFGSAVGSINDSGETATADINFPATTTVTGRVFRPDGTTALPGAKVYVENYDGGGSSGRFYVIVTADSSGSYTATGVPAGLIKVTAGNPNDITQAGTAQLTLDASAPAVVNVTLGNVLSNNFINTLIGADGFRYEFWSYAGALDDGGSTDDRLGRAYNGAYYLKLQDNWRYDNYIGGDRNNSSFYTVTPEDGGRELAYGYDTLFGLRLRRKVFVPAEGGFARYLEFVENPTDRPISINVGMEAWFGSYSPSSNPVTDTRFTVLVPPSETGNTYAVTRFNDDCCHPNLAHVFAGPGARVPVSDARVYNDSGSISQSRSEYHWNVTVAPRQTAILMHFSAQHDPADAAGARAQAEALANLTDPKALQGMSDEEKAEVVNFQIGGAGASTSGKVAVQASHADGTPVANAPVYIREAARGDATRAVGRTDAQGRLTISDVPVGAFTVRAYSPANADLSAEAAGSVSAPGEVVPVALVLTGTGSVAGRVTYRNGLPANAAVQVSGPDMPARSTTTDASGNYLIAGIPVGRVFAVRASNPSDPTVYQEVAGNTLTSDGQRITADMTLPLSGTVQGTVVAGDGQTPVHWGRVEFFDVATGRRVGSTSTDFSGYYQAQNILLGDQGVRVRAYSDHAVPVTGEAVGLVPDGSTTVTVNVTIPEGVVHGTVFRSDGTTRVFYPSVSILQTDAGGTVNELYSYQNDDQGHYTVVGVAPGSFTVKAREWEGTEGRVTATLTNVAATTNVDVVLPQGGTITGTVYDAAHNPVPGAQVTVWSSPLEYQRWASADSQGNYRIERAVTGPYVIQALNNTTGDTGLAHATLANDGDTASVNVTFPPATGHVRGSVQRANGSPAAGAQVTVENFANSGPLGPFTVNVTTDAAGNYDAPAVALGAVRVMAFDPSNVAVAGVADGSSVAGETSTVNVTLGGASVHSWNDPFNLDGADGFRYDVTDDGSLKFGGTTDGRLSNAYDGTYYLKADGWWFANRGQTVTTEDGGREVVISPDVFDGLQMRRKVYVPAEGGFARYLDILTNTTAQAKTVTVGGEGWLGPYTDTHVVVSPSQTSNRYAVTDMSGACCSPSIAHVLGGAGAPVPVAAFQLDAFGHFTYRWDVTVQPGQTVIVMHFTAQRDAADAAGAGAQAEALVDLSDPKALEGMSDEEKAEVVNFQIPNQAGARNEIPNIKATTKGDALGARRDNPVTAPDPARRDPSRGGRPSAGLRADGAGRESLQKR
jgi:protocatechuate 3,4-dioxygenase beta subunit